MVFYAVIFYLQFSPNFPESDVIFIQTLKLIIDNDTVNRYNEFYFMKYPYRTKAPITSPIHPSLNIWTKLKRDAQNVMKQQWNDFTVWFIHDFGLTNKKIDKCKIHVTNYFKDLRVHDLDNVTIKFFQDGFVNSGFLVKDDYKHIQLLSYSGDYDKFHCRTEFYVTYDY